MWSAAKLTLGVGEAEQAEWPHRFSANAAGYQDIQIHRTELHDVGRDMTPYATKQAHSAVGQAEAICHQILSKSLITANPPPEECA